MRSRALTQAKRSAFTLLETILSLGLLMLLIAAMVTAVQLLWRYRNSSIQQTRPALIASGLLDDFASDLRACIAAEPAATEPSSLPSVGPTFDSLVGEKVLQFAASDQEEPLRFIGRPHAMAFLRASDNSRFGAVAGAQDRDNFVIWIGPELPKTRLPVAKIGNRIEERFFSNSTNEPCLLRISSPSKPRTTLQNTAAVAINPLRTPIADISAIQFRYFDGQQWQQEWNSHLQNERLPLAVEINFRLTSFPGESIRITIDLPSGTRIDPTLKRSAFPSQLGGSHPSATLENNYAPG